MNHADLENVAQGMFLWIQIDKYHLNVNKQLQFITTIFLTVFKKKLGVHVVTSSVISNSLPRLQLSISIIIMNEQNGSKKYKHILYIHINHFHINHSQEREESRKIFWDSRGKEYLSVWATESLG
ncbi:hypothetical protein ACJX0J_010591 [Zea mays]